MNWTGINLNKMTLKAYKLKPARMSHLCQGGLGGSFHEEAGGRSGSERDRGPGGA